MTVTFNPAVITNSSKAFSQEYRLNKNRSYAEKIAATKHVVSVNDVPRGAVGRPNLYTHLIAEATAVVSADSSKAWAIGPFTNADTKSITQGLRNGIKKLGLRDDLSILQRKVSDDSLMIYVVAKTHKKH